MSFLTSRWRRDPTVRLRPIPEQSVCLVYRPRPPALLPLQGLHWEVLDMVDGSTGAELINTFRARYMETHGVAAGAWATEAIAGAMAELADWRLVEAGGPPSAEFPTNPHSFGD